MFPFPAIAAGAQVVTIMPTASGHLPLKAVWRLG
ncbi:hypothetical protein I656_00437 [Geobacillus sp. WSUCF1]|nr:hypothetical protein I656_00437 [Geobacillus sp. WSUCF1]